MNDIDDDDDRETFEDYLRRSTETHYYRLGRLAAKKGKTLDDNPYREGAAGYFDWINGWFSPRKQEA